MKKHGQKNNKMVLILVSVFCVLLATLPIVAAETCTDSDVDGYSMMGGACGLIDCDDGDATKYPPQYTIPETNWDWWTPTICTNCAYTGQCSYTSHSSFTLTAPTYIEQFGIWADVNYGIPTYVFKKDGVIIATGTLINTGTHQGNWYHLKFAWDKTVMPGSYYLSIDRTSQCSPTTNGEGHFRGNGAPLVCVSCADNDNDGYYAGNGNCGPIDCNDGDATIHPGATEICDGVDNNCNGQTDENLGTTPADNIQGACSNNVKICSGGNWIINPSNYQPTTEICNGIDDDCDGQIDEACVPPSCVNAPSGLISWWPGDGNGNDIWNTNPGTVYGATFALGKVEQTFSFDGVDDYVFNGNTPNIDGGSQATYEAWVYPKAEASDGNYFAILTVGDATVSNWYPEQCRMLYINPAGVTTSKFYLDCGTDNANIYTYRMTDKTYPINNWYHVVATFNNGVINVYVNGVLDNGGAGGSGTVINTGAANMVAIGAMVRSDRSVAAAYFNGLIDEVSIYNRALTAAEIQSIYSAGSEGKCKPVCTDADGDGFYAGGGACAPVDCNDNNAAVNPGHAEVCNNNIDDDCDGLTDENCVSDSDGDGVADSSDNCPSVPNPDQTDSDGSGGSAQTIYLRPNANGDSVPLSPYGCSGDDWTCLTDYDGETWSYVFQYNMGVSQLELANFQDLPAGVASISRITIYDRIWATNAQYKLAMKTGGTTYYGTAANGYYDYFEFDQTYTTNPQTGQPWTVSDINNIQAGVEFLGTAGWNNLFWAYIKVEYTNPSGDGVGDACDCNDNVCDGREKDYCTAQGTPDNACTAYMDNDGDGYTTETDCNDNNAAINPGATEVCDGVDNDCDDQTDENFDVGTTCSAGVGMCSATGNKVCSQDGSATVCNAVAGAPSPEVCNGKDDDCDSTVDEGLIQAASNTQGLCSGNTQTCSAGAWSDTQGNYMPAPETCNGLDDDCDGQTDEELTRQTTCGLGICAGNTGTETCANGGWGGNTCDPLKGATNDVCDGIDNDCDGQVDEEYVADISCFKPGVCAAGDTASTCVNGVETLCRTGAPGPREICDSKMLDEDCDGTQNEYCTGECYEGNTKNCGPETETGECRFGTQSCSSNGAWGLCLGAVYPANEICDDKDNDCDGQVDEGCGSEAALENTLITLQGLQSSNSNTNKELGKAAEHLQNALYSDKITWLDGSHLACKHGNSAFDELKGAVEALAKISDPKEKDKYDPILKPAVDDSIAKILDASRLLATTLVSEATQASKKDVKILQEANQAIIKGDEARAKGDYNKAIDDYKKAWQSAKSATYQDLGCAYCDLDWSDNAPTCGA